MRIQISKWAMVLAVIFIIIAITCIVFSFLCEYYSVSYIAISSTFATLAGAILVFSTLDIQRKLLEEEMTKNEISRFDSKFYPILSSFRMDAANMENKLDRIKEKGKGSGTEYSSLYYGDNAFYINRKLLELLSSSIRKDSFEKFDAENIQIELDEINKKEVYLLDNCYPDEEIDKVVEEKTKFLHSQQASFLLHKYGITKEIWQEYKDADEQVLISFLLNKMLSYQPTILSKYLEALRFILHIINKIPKEIDKRDYYLNVSCQMGKEELLFLKCFKEFDILTRYQTTNSK